MENGYTLRDYDINSKGDAVKLGKMFASFDSAWPGGFTSGLDPNPDYLFEATRRMQRLAICVVEFNDDFVGYCDLHAQTGNHDLAYIPLLGASPDHHGKGVGKSLLLEMIRRVTKLGFRELTLDTWAGNMKAVPLYKKTGFNWEPETSVLMRNFMPGLLNSAAGRSFFSGRDWYKCLEREIDVEPDDVTWQGMRVFPYTFRADGSILKATFEMASGGMTALETDAFRVSCSIPAQEGEAPAGETLPISWQITPLQGQSLEVFLLTEADTGLEINVREQFRTGEPLEITRSLRVNSDAAPKHRGERERLVRSTLIVNGTAVVLETGVEVVRPIDIDFTGQGLFPGRAETIEIRLKSNLDHAVSGTLSLDSHPGVAGSGTVQDFTLPARLSTQCVFELTGIGPGVCHTYLRYRAGIFNGTRPVAFRVFGSIAPVVSVDTSYDEEIVVESPGMKMTHQLRGGQLRIKNKSAGHSYSVSMPEPGPPFASMRRRKLLYSSRVEHTGADACVVMQAEYPEFPGLIVERRVVQMSGDLVRLDFTLVNTSDFAMQTRLRFNLGHFRPPHMVLPIAGSIVREPGRDWDPYPAGAGDALKTPDSLSESWLAAEHDRNVSGLIWRGTAQLEMDWGAGVTLDAVELPSNSGLAMAPLYAVVGAGNWQSVRGWWRKLVQKSDVKEKSEPTARRVLQVRTERSPQLLTEDTTVANLVVDNLRGRSLSGEVTLTSPELSIDPLSLQVQDINRDNTFRAPIVLGESGGFGAGYFKAELKTAHNSRTFRLPVVRLGSAGTVSVSTESDGNYAVSNGVLRYCVSPGFLGSITSLEAAGVNQLHSAWPKARPFVWANPWYGGVHPFLEWIGDEQLTREKFTGGPVEVTGETGLVWHGVRVSCSPKHRDLRWLQIEAEYVTLPGSDVIALICRWKNLSNAQQSQFGGIAIWAAAGGDRTRSIAHWTFDGELRHRRRTIPGMDVQGLSWAAVENDANGHRLEAVATGSDSKVFIDDMSEEGSHLGIGAKTTLDPGETSETLSWLIVNPAVSEFEAYAELKGLDKLP